MNLFNNNYIKLDFKIFSKNYIVKMGIGDWGLGIGDWGLGPIPNHHPQSPIPNPQSPFIQTIFS
jgi:hypothetical protein